MKALTVYQPWATLIVAGAKPYEFRKWSLRERGPAYAALIGQRIVIHAASRPIVQGEVDAICASLVAGGGRAAETCLHRDKAMELLECLQDGSGRYYREEKFPLSAGLGTAVLGEPRDGYEIAGDFGVQSVNDSDRDDQANFGWPMLEIEAWHQPVPMRGFQGFWNWPTPGDAGL